MDVALATLMQRWNVNVKFTTSSQDQYYDIAPTLHRLWKERKTWTIHGDMVTFPQPCLKVVKKIINGITFIWYSGLIL